MVSWFNFHCVLLSLLEFLHDFISFSLVRLARNLDRLNALACSLGRDFRADGSASRWLHFRVDVTRVLAIFIVDHSVSLNTNVLAFRREVTHAENLMRVIAAFSMCYANSMVFNVKDKSVLSYQSTSKHNLIL